MRLAFLGNNKHELTDEERITIGLLALRREQYKFRIKCTTLEGAQADPALQAEALED